MKLQLSIALAAATLFAGAAFAADEPIKVFGLDKLHWGINAADTRAAVPSLKIHSQLAGESELLNETFVYSGCRYRLSLLFTDDRLTNLSVVSAENDPGCNLNIKDMIDQAYGPPNDSNTLTDGITYGWKKGTTRIDSTHSPLLNYTHATVEMWEAK